MTVTMKCLPLLLALSAGLAHATPDEAAGATPENVERFARSLQSALQRHDAPGVAALVAFPLRVGAEASEVNGEWVVKKAIMSRSARVLMEGYVRIPGDSF
mgnify:CR=1 FL=1